MRHLVGDAVEILKRQIDFCFSRDSEQVQNSIRRSSKCHHYRDCILESLFGQNLSSGNALGNQVHYCSSRAVRPQIPTAISRRRGS